MGIHQDLYAIGFISGAFGIRGEVKVEPTTYSVERFTEGMKVWIGKNESADLLYTIDSVRTHAQHVVVKFAEVPTRDACEELIGKYLFVEKADRVVLPARTWFISDIIGLTVFDEEGKQVGKIVDVLHLPANDVYVLVHGNHEILIPATSEVVKDVNTGNRTMTIHVMNGLLDL